MGNQQRKKIAKPMDVMLMMAVLPAAVLLYYVYRLDPVEKEPAPLLLRLLFYGMLSTLVALVFELAGNALLFGGETPSDPTGILVENFIVVAVVEECSKFGFLRRITWNDPNFNFAFDGIVYAVFVGLGFAIAENINYVFTFGIGVAFGRAFTAIPGHCIFAVLMGYFYGRARSAKVRGHNVACAVYLVCAVVIPIFCHGTYDTLATFETDAATYAFWAFLLLLMAVGMALAKHAASKAERIY